MKDLLKMQQQAKKMQKKLENIHIEAEHEGVTVTVNGNMELMSVKFSSEAWDKGPAFVEDATKEAFKKAMKKAQEVAAENMKDILGSLGLPQDMGALGQ